MSYEFERLPQRLQDKITVVDGCWEWGGFKGYDGYGRVSVRNRMRLIHRVVYTFYKGRIPKDYQVDHLCKNRICCRPDHLEAITQAENVRRGDSGHNQAAVYIPPKVKEDNAGTLSSEPET